VHSKIYQKIKMGKTKKIQTDMLRNNSNSPGSPWSQSSRRKKEVTMERICRKGRFKLREKESGSDG